VAIKIVSFLVIFIIMVVMANTMAMTVRERMAEYATLKALGFGPWHLALLIFGESLAIAGFGAAVGIALTFPVADRFGKAMGSLFRVFNVHPDTVYMQAAAALIVGVVAALVPCVRAAHIRIVDGLRSIG
jgi:putative ABC transport system permease protein